MKRGKNLLILLGVLAVLIAAAATAPLLTPDAQQTEETPAVTVFTLNPEQLTGLSWTYGEETLDFGYKNGSWYYTQDTMFPVDADFLEEIKGNLTQIVAEKTVETPDDLENYGLLRPACTVTVTTEGVTTRLELGDETAMDGLRYLSLGDNKVYLVDGALFDCLQYGLYDIVSYETVPAMDAVTELKVETGEQTLTLEYREESGLAYSDSYVWFVGERAADTELTESFLAKVTGLVWDSCVAYNADEEALAGYGLDTPAVTGTVHYGEAGEQQFTVQLGLTEEGCFARLPGSGMVYEIDSAIAETLLYTTYAELQPDEVLVMDWDTVETVTVELEEERYRFTREMKEVADSDGNITREAVYLLNGEETALQEILDSLEAMASAGYANGAAPERKAELTVVLGRNTEAFPEVRLSFFRHDSSTCLVQLNGESTVFVSREAVVELKEAITALVLG